MKSQKDPQWKTVIDFTTIDPKGVSGKVILEALAEMRNS